ncbi:MAG: DNA translocase FtsK 4TM domain-containing protein, partial [Acetobacteraceae bacterium]|nr:DNA translocase FtsK 4TM domain-containing protein [Acetobacteraceae bacterium]
MQAAARTAALSERRLASPAVRSVAGRRLRELGGLALGLAGLALLVALASYDPADPSLNTATARHTANLAGPVGATVSDLLLQGFGLAAVLPGFAMLAWAWRIASGRGLGSILARLLATAAGVPVLASVLAGLASLEPQPPNWPAAGPGGAAGAIISRGVLDAGRGVFGPLGVASVWGLGLALAATLVALSFGLTAAEWRGAARMAGRLVPVPVWRRRGTAPRARGRLAAATGAVARLFRRRAPGLTADPTDAAGRRPARAVPQTEAPLAPPAPPVVHPVIARPKPSASGRRAAVARQQEALPLEEGAWRLPPLSLLHPAAARASTGPSRDALEANARLLETVLGDYGVQGHIADIRPGPVVTLYELEPAPGIRSARVIGLADDVARSLSVTAVRIATVPGRNVIGIEVPNAKRETVYLSEVLAADDVQNHAGRLSLALGKDIGGEPIVADLARMPHLMIAGTTGSGKSVGVNAMILSLLYKLSPDQCRFILIDPKMLELSVYGGIPHLMAPVVTEPKKAVVALKWTVREMERRYRAMSQLGVRNIAGYNDRVAEARAKGEVVTRRVQTGFDPDTGRPVFEEQPLQLEPLPLIVVVVDEMADLMMVAGKEIEAAVQRLAQMARAAGIHVIMATQRPSVDVITGTIKANFPTRVSFQVTSKIDSRTILGEMGAEQLLGQGDMLYMAGGGRISRVHGPFVSDDEVEKVVRHLKSQGQPQYLEAVTKSDELEEGEDGAVFDATGMGVGDATD